MSPLCTTALLLLSSVFLLSPSVLAGKYNRESWESVPKARSFSAEKYGSLKGNTLRYKHNFETTAEENAYIKQLYTDHEAEVDEALRKLLEGSRENADSTTRSQAECQDAMVADLSEIWLSWEYVKAEVVSQDVDESVECSLCTLVVGFLRQLVCNLEYQQAVDFSIRLCEIVLEQVNNRQDICNGTITLQAPFGFTAVKEVTPYVMCESLNRCIPPPNDQRPSVAERVDKLLASSNDRLQEVPRGPKTRNDNPIKIAHLADVHISPRYGTGSAIYCDMYVCCIPEYGGEGEARMYGEYECNIPVRTMHHFMEKLNEIDPDLIVFTGDAPPHIIWEQTFESQLNCTEILVESLKDKFLNTAGVYTTFGNHDPFPTNTYSGRVNYTMRMNEAFTELWKDLSGFGPDQEATMRQLGYYSVPAANLSGLRILSMNNMHYSYNKNFMCTLNANSTDEAEYREFVIDTLENARSNNEKVIIISHQPPGGADQVVSVSRWFENLVLEYHDVILIHMAGHWHRDEFHLYMDHETMEAKAINIVSTSVTANLNVNPSLKILYLDRDSYEITDIESYYMELDEQRPNNPPPIVKLYDAREEYGMSDFSPESWKDLSLRLLEDPALFQTWFDNKAAQAMLDTCNGSCPMREVCRMWFLNYDEVEECTDYLTSLPVGTTTTPAPSTTTPLPVGRDISKPPAVQSCWCHCLP